MSEAGTDWIRVVERLATGDRTAYAQLGRLVTGYLTRLRAYDFHYYDRAPHSMTGGGERPLPVLRVVFEDAYPDPFSLEVFSEAGVRLEHFQHPQEP